MKRPAAWIAAGLFVPVSLAALAPFGLHWFFLSGRVWPRDHHEEILRAAGVVLVLSALVVFVGLASLLRRAFRTWRLGAWAWALAATATGLWPLAALLPAAIRLGNRSAARFSAWGGALLLVGAACRPAGRFAESAVLYWALLTAAFAGAGLVLAALRRLDDSAPPHRALARAFVALVAVTVAVQPAFHAGRVSREADAARAALLASLGPLDRPATEFPVVPPVAEADDPVAALDPDALEAERKALDELQRMLRRDDGKFRLHPLTAEEASFVLAWFAAHTNLAAAADAVSASPGYRSCLPGPGSFEEAAEEFRTSVEPRTRDGLLYAGAIQLRARAALATGDAAAGPDAFSRLDNLAALFDRNPALLEHIVGSSVRGFKRALLAERIDLLDDETLRAVERAADDAAAEAGTRFREALAGEVLLADAGFRGSRTEGIARSAPFLRASRAFDYWIAFERRAYFRNLALGWNGLAEVFATPAGEPVHDALDRLEKDEVARGRTLPALTQMLSPAIARAGAQTVIRPRNLAALVHAAVAIERYRRAHGAPPPSLEALVPDALPAVPVEARTGEPFRYEAGPFEIPEEDLPALRDPDATATEAEEAFRARYGDDKLVQFTRILESFGEEDDEPPRPTRTLPAATLPGFRLTLPDSRGRADWDITYAFYTPGPMEESHAEFAESAEPKPHAEFAESAEPKPPQPF